MSNFTAGDKIYRGSVDLTDRNSAWTKIVTMVPERSRVLEIGCASGTLSRFLAQVHRCTVTGVEINAAAAAEAAPFCQTVLVADVEANILDTLNEPFDVIILADVLEHLRDPEGVLRRTHRHLTKDGVILLSLPNIAHWSVRYELLRGRFSYADSGLLDATHLRFFTYRSACDLIARAGFQILSFDVVHRCPLYWRLSSLYRVYETLINRFVRNCAPNLLGYQLIFGIAPIERGAR